MSGEWVIGQQPPLPGNSRYVTQVIAIETHPGVGNEPAEYFGEAGLAFQYGDGRYIMFPWASIVRLEYRPTPLKEDE